MPRTTIALVLHLLTLLAVPTAGAQEYRTSIVVLAPYVAGTLARDYSERDEKVWCVTAWDSTADRTVRGKAFTVYTVRDVQENTAARTSESDAEMDPAQCRTADRLAMPTIHSHPRGMCQPGPGDNEMILQRMAPFDGILCGDRYHTWSYSANLVAVLALNAQAEVRARAGEGKP